MTGCSTGPHLGDVVNLYLLAQVLLSAERIEVELPLPGAGMLLGSKLNVTPPVRPEVDGLIVPLKPA